MGNAISTAQDTALPEHLSETKLWIAGILLAAANFLAVLDVTIANVSVSNISGSLGISKSQGLWVITSYAVAEAITVPLTGWLAGRFGAVRIFVTAMLGFGFFSALCGLAPTLESLILFRVFQGLAGGPLMPLSQTLLMRIFPQKSRSAALALWSVTTLIAPVMGPVLGGALCDNLGWPWIFWVNVPIAMVCGPLLWQLLKSSETPTAKARIDGIGLVLLTIWVAALQVMLDLGKEHDWFASSLIVALTAIAVVGFASFLVWELTEPDPIVALGVFRHRGFTISVVTLSLAFGAFFATNIITPLWLQSTMGYTATWAGYVTGGIGVLAIVGAPVAAKLSEKVDPRILIFVGILWLAGAAFLRGGASTDMTFWRITTLMVVTGLGMPFFFLPLTGIALASVSEEQTASAAGIMNFIRTVAGAFATSIVNTVWETSASRNQNELAGTLHEVERTLSGLEVSGMTRGQAVESITNLVVGQATMLATNQVFVSCALVFVVAAVTIWLAPKPTRASDTSAVH